MKIYTKTGDKGETGLFGGKRITKDSLRMSAIGTIDELNALLGVCRAQIRTAGADSGSAEMARFEKMLHHLQQELFELGADLAMSARAEGLPRKVAENQNCFDKPKIEAKNLPGQTFKSGYQIATGQAQRLEQWIDEIDPQLEPLKNFILPGGSILAANLHLARTICRRAERVIVGLFKKESGGENILPYINRLSDLLFVMARWANKYEGVAEEKWIAGSNH